MEELEIINLYERTEPKRARDFMKKSSTELNVKLDKKSVARDLEWIQVMMDTIPYLDNIFRKPNRFIINEEEIMKIEQTKKVTVESIKHLSKNTNLIQTVDDVTGDVTPSKLLNVRKEETFSTYENRFVYTLMQNMKLFIKKRKEAITGNSEVKTDSKLKNTKNFEYQGNTKIGDEKVDIKVSLNSSLDNEGNKVDEEVQEILNDIEELERQIMSLEASDVYKTLEKDRVLLVRDPIKKTNVILKNVNFQYAMKLWDYLRDNYEDKTTNVEEKKNYEDNGNLKKLMDENFLLQYLTMKTLDEDDSETKESRQEMQDVILEKMIDKMIDLNLDLSEKEIKQLVATRYEVLKYKRMEVIKEIQKIFKSRIDIYARKVEGK
ncbi:MAG: DUF2357 domain-containing protein [Clostridia bacterium]|nr:DUF2357 domain-containing protein [Clostridia bacterium]